MKRNGDDEKFMAEVLAIGNECDLALLTVKNENFWKDAKLLRLGALPRLKVAPLVITPGSAKGLPLVSRDSPRHIHDDSPKHWLQIGGAISESARAISQFDTHSICCK